MPALFYQTAGKQWSTGYNVNASTIPARRVVGRAAPVAASLFAIDTLAALANVEKAWGVTRTDIPTLTAGDVAVEDDMIVPVDTTAAAVNAGDKLTVEQATGKVLVAAPGAGTNAEIVGIAESSVSGSGGTIQMRIKRYIKQG